jgi:hypothetical protein
VEQKLSLLSKEYNNFFKALVEFEPRPHIWIWGGVTHLSRARFNFTTIPIDWFKFACSFQKLLELKKKS